MKLQKNILFYDGHCGLCHHTVKFVLKHDKKAIFRFAPLQGDLFQQTFSEEKRKSFPDSMVLITEDERVLMRSSATAYLLQKIGGFWGVLGHLLQAIPRSIRDGVYVFIAKVRHQLFRRPDEVCPLLPDNLKNRFLL